MTNPRSDSSLPPQRRRDDPVPIHDDRIGDCTDEDSIERESDDEEYEEIESSDDDPAAGAGGF